MKTGGRVGFQLDGRAVKARRGETVLSVARRNGIAIPTLCHHESVAPYGACRLCLVEVFRGARSKLITSCIYVASDGDVIKTNNERIRRTRRMIIEFLLSRCPGVEVLQELAREYGVDVPRFDARKAEERCILCGLCVRVCDEAVGQHAIGYANRGSERVIAPPFGENAEDCIGCGACVFVCPTGALHYEDIDGKRTMKELHTTLSLLKCSSCGRPFATEKQIAKMKEKLKLPDELAGVCPQCRGTKFRGVMEEVLGKKK